MSATADEVDRDTWALQLVGLADFNDQRLNERFISLLSTFASKPLDAIPQACDSDAETKACYRFLSNRRVTAEYLLAPLVKYTVANMRGHATVYAVQDSTSLNFSTLDGAVGLGPLNDSPYARGLHLHTTLALRSDGLPFGLLHQHYWSRPPRDPKAKAADHHEVPFAMKESYKWMRGIRAAEAAIDTLPEAERPRLIHVGDREEDIHEVLEHIHESGHSAVIRSAQNRLVDGAIGRAHDAVAASRLIGIHVLEIPARAGHSARTARLELRAITVTITPDREEHPQRQPFECTLVEAREIDPPAGIKHPLHWRLWTFEPAKTKAQILEILRIYTLRWRIEDFHLTLKSGCGIERLELQTAERLIKATILYSAVAARIVTIRDLGRREPDTPCTNFLSDIAWRVLFAHIKKKAPDASTPVPTTKQAVLWIGRLGGHMNRKGDGMPGVRTLWRGYRDLTLLITGYRLGRAM